MASESINLVTLLKLEPGTPVSFSYDSILSGLLEVRGFIERVRNGKIHVGPEKGEKRNFKPIVFGSKPYSGKRIIENSIYFEGFGDYQSHLDLEQR